MRLLPLTLALAALLPQCAFAAERPGVAGGKARRVVDSTSIGERRELSDAEKARRERERIAQLKGIVAYRWSPDGKRLLFTLDERLWLCDLAAPADKQLRALTPKTVTRPTVAPSDRPPPIEARAATLPIRLKGRLTSTSQVCARQ